MLSLTPDQILALAPDDASRKAGQGLANAGKWVSAGRTDRAVWGECQGSGSKPYQTVADAGALAFKCSCPSRKFPCKHGVGMLLYQVKDDARFAANSTEPAWVSDWMDKRQEKAAAPPAAKADKPKDEAAQAKRQAAREDKVNAGIDELSLWMKDAMRTGIMQLPEKGAQYFEEVARRLVDAQAGGLARMVRELGDINYFGERWHTEALDGFARLHMAISGYQNIDKQDAAVAQELRNTIGFQQGADVLEGQPILPDTWFVAGSETDSEGALTVEKHWLLSSEGRAGLLLQYVPYGQRPGVNLFVGQSFQGEVQHYPAALPLRLSVRNPEISKAPAQIPMLADWNEVAAQESQHVAQWPLVRELPYAVAALRPVKTPNGQWLIEDQNGRQMRLRDTARIWDWMALSGGNFLPTAVLGAEHAYRPLGLWFNNTYISLA